MKNGFHRQVCESKHEVLIWFCRCCCVIVASLCLGWLFSAALRNSAYCQPADTCRRTQVSARKESCKNTTAPLNPCFLSVFPGCMFPRTALDYTPWSLYFEPLLKLKSNLYFCTWNTNTKFGPAFIFKQLPTAKCTWINWNLRARKCLDIK